MEYLPYIGPAERLHWDARSFEEILTEERRLQAIGLRQVVDAPLRRRLDAALAPSIPNRSQRRGSRCTR